MAESAVPRDPNQISNVTRSKEEASAYYTKLSRWYDWMTAGAERAYTASGVKQMGVRDGESVLEIGFGTGYALEQLARAVGDGGSVCGVDIAQGMLLVAQERLIKARLLQRVKLSCGDATSLPFQCNSFDAVLLSFVLELFDTPEIPVVLREVQRVLKPGGRVTVVSMLKKEQWSVSIYEWFHRKCPTAVDCRPIYARQSLESVRGLVVSLCSERSMWGLPLQVVTATKCDQDNTKDLSTTPCTVPTESTANWVPDAQAQCCLRCRKSFNFVRRRHHCRACGDVFCDSCCSECLCVPGRDPVVTVRVCDGCYAWHPRNESSER